ncbi:hypothetical protein ECBCE007MS11_4917 [Escherichia coli BCE007_MS-11]|nr:hypothetical protein ECMP02101710_4914 [Escherichia coli MP021017.10]EMW27025.1 hypothetical protein EC2845350_4828 [Escherichia coli 2845350]ENA26730.1 hypothetical protein ECBCE007MS11_4917 [Escherichia coli BCE007_MS-11]ENA73465.1 hypothetical protein EC2730450_4812 [Escherichia coli 2730450]ENA89093.1 hypothetical protein EC2862600_4777 [Escherichia coli 2862600]END61925.1 hypothetical protein ECP02989423_4960 [Escherichia coli P0298942.3]
MKSSSGAFVQGVLQYLDGSQSIISASPLDGSLVDSNKVNRTGP